jgi:hypothetical protein
MYRTKSLVFVVFLLLAAQIQAGDTRAFEVNSLPGFSVQGSGDGDISVSNNCVCFKTHKTKLWVHPELEKYKPQIVGVRFGLAYETNGENWDILGYAPMHRIGGIISIDNPIKVLPFETSMPVPKDLEKKKYWVVMQIVMKDIGENGVSYSYAHEGEGLK